MPRGMSIDDEVGIWESEGLMFCSSCGSQVVDQAKFCSACGAAMSQQPIVQAQSGDVQPQAGVQQVTQMDRLQTVSSNYGKRSEAYLSCRVPPENAVQIAEQILMQNGFKQKDYKGEAVWRKGTGVATSMQFVKLAAFDGSLGIQAWVQSGLGNVGLPEQCLDGFVGVVPKKMLLKVLDQIQAAI